MSCLAGPETNSVTEDSENTTESDSQSIGDLEESPVSIVELPSSTDDEATVTSYLTSSYLLAYNSDADLTVPVTGGAGAVADFETGQMVAVSQESLEVTTASLSLRGARSTTWQSRFSSFLISNAYADASSSVCDSSTVECCAINTDGSFECFLPLTDSSLSSVYVTIVDADGAVLTDSTEEQIHGNLLYTATAPNDVVVVDDTVYSVTDGIAVMTATDGDGDLVMSGSHDDSYRALDVPGPKFAFDDENEMFGFMDATGGVTATMVDGVSLGTRTIEGATAYTKIKNTSYNKVYFGVEKEDATEAEIYYYYRADESDYFDTDDIPYIQSGNVDDSGVQLTKLKDITFDVNSVGYVLVVYQDIAGSIRIRASNGTTMFGGGAAIADSGTQFADIQFIDDEKAFLIDMTNDRVLVVHLDVASQTITLGESIAVGDNPVSGVFNSIKSRFNVLNAGASGTGESVSVINTKNEDDSVRIHPQVVAIKNLSDLLTDKTLTFTPNVITKTGDAFVIGSTNLTALVILNASDITETALTDEDNDGDGYTGNQGDCDDDNAELNPDTVWYLDYDGDGYGKRNSTTAQCTQPTGYAAVYGDCRDRDSAIYPGATELCDSKDNDCDGTVDEDVTMSTWYADSDSDGFGDASSSTSSCSQPTGYVSDNTDCDDGESTTNPEAEDECDDGVDNNCDSAEGIYGIDCDAGRE